HLRHLRQRGLARASWVPIQRERILHQLDRATERQRLEQDAQVAAANVTSPQSESVPLSPRDQRREDKRRRRSQRRNGWGWPFRGGWIWIIGGYWLLTRLGFSLDSLFQPQATRGVVLSPTGATNSPLVAQSWLSSFIPALNRIPTLTPQDPE